MQVEREGREGEGAPRATTRTPSAGVIPRGRFVNRPFPKTSILPVDLTAEIAARSSAREARFAPPLALDARFTVPPVHLPHVLADGCSCTFCAAARVRGFLASSKVSGPELLASRAAERAAGLSNSAYRAVSSHTAIFRAVVTPSRVRFQFSDPVAELATRAAMPSAPRGIIRELSAASRDRLADRAWTLAAEGRKPSAMLTLTAPGEWESLYLADSDGVVIEGGRVIKAQMKALRKRLGRFLVTLGVPSWSALWFLEFQARGAPHIHLMLFDCTLSADTLRRLRGWLGRAWAEIVAHPNPVERAKHVRAGTRVEKMRSDHFGYAVKYATKTEQKEVPREFGSVGRFWGCWNYTAPEPVYVDLGEYSRLNPIDSGFVRDLVYAALASVWEYAPNWVTARMNKLEYILTKGLSFKTGFSVFGSDASISVLSLVGG